MLLPRSRTIELVVPSLIAVDYFRRAVRTRVEEGEGRGERKVSYLYLGERERENVRLVILEP